MLDACCMLSAKQENTAVFWIQLYGTGADGKPGVDNIGDPFPSLDAAISKAKALATTNTFYWGKATGYRIINEAKAIVHEGKI